MVDYLVLGDEPHLVANECTSCGARFFDRRNACAGCFGTDFRQVPVEETRLLLGLNAVRCYDLDLDALSAIAAEIGPTPTQLNQDLDRRTPPDAVREARFWFDDYGIEWKG